jgi:DNA-binding NarL/FixJ family response regulator
MQAIRVLIADDQPVVRNGLKATLGAVAGVVVVGEAQNGTDAVRMVRATRPDVVLMDISMPLMTGLEATRRISGIEEAAHTRVIILTMYDQDEHVFEALRAGASGFVIKDSDPAQLLHAIRVVAAGESLLSPSVTRRVISEYTGRPSRVPRHPQLAHLTEREREVVELVGEGLSNEQIAQRLVVSPATARTHVSRAMVKLHCRDRAQLVVFAYQSGLVEP